MKKATLIRKPKELSRKEMDRLNGLHLPYGQMWPTLLTHFDDPDTRVCIIKVKKQTVGWGLLYYTRRFLLFKHPIIQIFVSEKFRRLGIGTSILSKLTKLCKSKPYVCPHDYASETFFSKFLANKKADRHWAY